MAWRAREEEEEDERWVEEETDGEEPRQQLKSSRKSIKSGFSSRWQPTLKHNLRLSWATWLASNSTAALITSMKATRARGVVSLAVAVDGAGIAVPLIFVSFNLICCFIIIIFFPLQFFFPRGVTQHVQGWRHRQEFGGQPQATAFKIKKKQKKRLWHWEFVLFRGFKKNTWMLDGVFRERFSAVDLVSLCVGRLQVSDMQLAGSSSSSFFFFLFLIFCIHTLSCIFQETQIFLWSLARRAPIVTCFSWVKSKKRRSNLLRLLQNSS